MKAAVVQAQGRAPKYVEFVEPIPTGDEALVWVQAAALKNIDKMMANGEHYAAGEVTHDFIPGVDGVGKLADGTRVYFGGARPPFGTFAEKSVVNKHWMFPLPDALDDATAAALPNAALSSWLPLVWRTKLQAGETVLILGATGVAGKLAIQVAKELGAGRVIAVGRNAEVLKTLPALGADVVISLEQTDAELRKTFRDAAGDKGLDVVLDYVWGHPSEVLIGALTGEDVMSGAKGRIRYVTIGEMAGPTIALPSEALRSTQLEMYGSGGGSVPHEVIREAFPQVMALGAEGKLRIDTETVPLAEVETVWERQDGNGRRFVFVP